MVFLGANGVSASRGLTTSDLEEAAVKRAMMRISQEIVVLADGTKFDAVFPAVFAEKLRERARDAVGLKTIVAYRTTFAIDYSRPAQGAIA